MNDSTEPADRALIDDSGDAMEIAIPVQKDWFKIFFLTVWMCGWCFGGAYAIRKLWNDDVPHADRAFLAAWVAFWVVGVGYGAANWLWNVAGIERARFRNDGVVIRREVFGIGLSREYDASRVGKLRLADDFQKGAASLRSGRSYGARIAFDYVETTVKFGLRLDRGEAARIILKIQKRFTFTRT